MKKYKKRPASECMCLCGNRAEKRGLGGPVCGRCMKIESNELLRRDYCGVSRWVGQSATEYRVLI